MKDGELQAQYINDKEELNVHFFLVIERILYHDHFFTVLQIQHLLLFITYDTFCIADPSSMQVACHK